MLVIIHAQGAELERGVINPDFCAFFNFLAVIPMRMYAIIRVWHPVPEPVPEPRFLVIFSEPRTGSEGP